MYSNKVLIDIEVFPNFFLLGFKDYVTGKTESIEVSPYKDEREKLIEWLIKYKGFVISFNGIYYDNVVLAFIKVEWESLNWLEPEDFCWKIKQFSDRVINSDSYWEELKPYKYVFQNQWKDVDLFLYWSKGLRQSKKISLKGLAIQLGYPIIMELPYDPDTYLTEEQIEHVKVYNLEHDLGVLNLLALAFEGKSDIPLGNLGTIQLREIAAKKYGINAWSYDPPKIASEVLLKTYCQKTNKNVRDVRGLRFDKSAIHFNKLFSDMKFDFQSDEFKSVFYEWMNSVDTFSKEFVVVTKSDHGLKISCGIGGLHNILSNKIYTEENSYKIIDIDIESLYPRLITNFKAFRFPEVLSQYVEFTTFRITETKPNIKKYKGTPEEQQWKNIDSFYKVILNGVSGYLDMEYSWLYYPEGIMKVRCGGQLILLTIIEQCWQNDILVIQANTDGLTVKIHESKIKWFYDLVSKTEKLYDVKFEYAEYTKMIFKSVNSYMAVSKDGKVKKKGSEFLTNPDLGNSVNFLVIPKCLELYFTKGIRPEVVLNDPKKYNLHIYDFCASFKTSRDYQVIWNNQKQQRLNRFFVSKGAPYLYKLKNSKTKPDNMLKGWGVQIFNNYEEKDFKDYKLDNKFYLSEINKLINELESCNQIKLF